MSAQRAGLSKQCGCPEAEWPKCHTKGRAHGYHYQRRVLTAGRSVQRSWSLNKWLKDRHDPRVITSRAKADEIVTEIDAAILAGTHDRPVAAPAPAADSAAITVDQLRDRFVAYLESRETDTWTNERGMLARLAAWIVPGGGRFGALPLAAVTSDHVADAFKAVAGRGAHSTRRKYKRTLRRCFTWAVDEGLLGKSPITKQTVLVAPVEIARTQRVRQPIVGALMAAARAGRMAAHRLAVMILAAVETGARRGELLAIRYADLDAAAGKITIRAIEKGARKSKRPRVVPYPPVLQAAIAALPACPTGKPWPDTAYVFGDVIGGRVLSVRKAWETAVLVAHGHTPRWTKSGGSLGLASRRALAAIDLHFHDLRHEAALRWHEQGLPLAAIAQLLGHKDLGQLQVYLGLAGDDALAALAALTTPAATGEPAPAAGGDGGKIRQNGGKTVVKPKPLHLVPRRSMG